MTPENITKLVTRKATASTIWVDRNKFEGGTLLKGFDPNDCGVLSREKLSTTHLPSVSAGFTLTANENVPSQLLREEWHQEVSDNARV